MTGTAEDGVSPAHRSDGAPRPPRPAHGFATEWCIDEEVPGTSEPATAAPAPGP